MVQATKKQRLITLGWIKKISKCAVKIVKKKKIVLFMIYYCKGPSAHCQIVAILYSESLTQKKILYLILLFSSVFCNDQQKLLNPIPGREQILR